jgi:hypothetical protein
MKQPAAATADNWINWRLAILLKGLSLSSGASARFDHFTAPAIVRELAERQQNGPRAGTAIQGGIHARGTAKFALAHPFFQGM